MSRLMPTKFWRLLVKNKYLQFLILALAVFTLLVSVACQTGRLDEYVKYDKDETFRASR